MVEPSAHYRGLFTQDNSPTSNSLEGVPMLLPTGGGVDQVDSVLPKLWRRGDIPGAPLSATEVSLLKDQRQPDA